LSQGIIDQLLADRRALRYFTALFKSPQLNIRALDPTVAYGANRNFAMQTERERERDPGSSTRRGIKKSSSPRTGELSARSFSRSIATNFMLVNQPTHRAYVGKRVCVRTVAQFVPHFDRRHKSKLFSLVSGGTGSATRYIDLFRSLIIAFPYRSILFSYFPNSSLSRPGHVFFL